MDISTAHASARTEASRLPAVTASLALLASATSDRATIALYGGTRPSPGGTPSGALLVTISCTARAGVIDSQAIQIVLDTPIEAQITGADAQNGTDATWARVSVPAGTWWADLSVSATSGNGEIKLPSTLLYNGAYARITSGAIQG